MGFSLKGVFGLSDCKPCHLVDYIAGVLGTEVTLTVCLAWLALCIYSILLVWVGLTLGRLTPLVTVVKVKQAESRFADYGAPRLHAASEENARRRNVYSGSGEEDW